jgi:hypothetical protein
MYLINRNGGNRKRGKGDCMQMYDSILSTEYNFISSKSISMTYIYFCTIVNTIKLVSSVKFSEPNYKVSIEITV